MKKNILMLAAVAAGIAGCSRHDSDTDACRAIEFYALSGKQVYILEDTSKEFGRDNDIAFSDSASIIMPEKIFDLDINPLREKILELAFDTVCPNPHDAMLSYFVNTVEELGYTAAAASDTIPEDEIDGFDYVLGDVYSLNNRRLTYRVAEYTYYPGAAHGMQNNSFVTFDLKDGEILTLHDLFTAEGLNALPSVIAKRAKRLESQLGPTKITALPSDGNFYISLEDEIVFVYQPYEAASFAQGMIYVPFYPYDLTEYLSPRGLAYFGLDEAEE